MESLRNEPVYLGGAPASGGSAPVILNTPATGGGFGDNGSLLSTVVLASLLGVRGGFGGGLATGDTTSGAALAYAQRAADNSSALLTSVTKAEGDIKEATNAAVQRLQIENAVNFNKLDNRLCDAEKEAIKAGYEARIESLNTKSDLLANQNANTISIKDDVKDFRFANDKQFCETNTNIDKQFCSLEHSLDKRFQCLETEVQRGFHHLAERELKEENRRLREQLESNRFRNTNEDIHELQRNVNKILCGLGNISPTVAAPNVLSGCC